MNKGVTVKQLYALCESEIKAGFGDKVILISDDDEGNGFHTLFYGFTDDIEDIDGYKECDMFHDDNNPRDVVILG